MRNPNSNIKTKLVIAICFALLCLGVRADAVVVTNGAGLSITMDSNGNYTVQSSAPEWTFGGEIAHPLKNAVTSSGKDSVGRYQRISFKWTEGSSLISGEIRLYDEKPLVLFSDTRRNAGEMPPLPFPSFTNLPKNLHVFSYRQETFSPPQFAANNCSTPWLLFDDKANALVISPASHFMVASMFGDGTNQVASGFNQQLKNLPAGFSQQTILAFGNGINRTWDLWGQSLRELEGMIHPHDDKDTITKYFGYWTDNGAYYYYNYDLKLGYQGTMESLVAHCRQEQIPIHYLQLDSWWYYKTFTKPDGGTGEIKSAQLPPGEWNRYGGLIEYKAHPAVFPDGLEAFHESIGLSLVTHNRWIDPGSPYHQKYNISGVAAVDPKWWDDTMGYIHRSGVETYEQDWLDVIYRYSPAFGSNLGTAESFLDNMARACKELGMTMQYCMPYPCYFLQGSRYDNLTTIRPSSDRFDRDKWNEFLYTSRLAQSMGIRPWTDVFMSRETNNLILSTLSSGPVGIGDAIGSENRENIFKAVRADGVIVKPDAPALPLDCCYLADARGEQPPMIAGTYTDHDGIKTAYLFAYNRSSRTTNEVRLAPADLGFSGPVYVYDYFSGADQLLKPGQIFSVSLNPKAVAYYIVAPIGKSGIAFLGDEGKFVSNGKQRIASLKDEVGELDVDVVFAPTEKSVVLHGYSAAAPTVSVESGEAGPVQFDAATGQCAVEIRADLQAPLEKSQVDPVRHAMVTLKIETVQR
jgi:hypothetical protein